MRHATGGQGPRPPPRRVAVANWVHALSSRVLRKRAAPAAALLGPNLACGPSIVTGLWVGIRDEFEASARTVRAEQERRRCQTSALSELPLARLLLEPERQHWPGRDMALAAEAERVRCEAAERWTTAWIAVVALATAQLFVAWNEPRARTRALASSAVFE